MTPIAAPGGGALAAAVAVSGLEAARAALAAAARDGCPAILIGDGASGGAGWFRALIAAAQAEYPEVAVTALLDCHDQPGLVLSGLRAGLSDFRFCGPAGIAERLAALAAAAGARLHRANPDTASPA
ncbi:MAG: hypothetical protein WCO00_01745 [Rhodospirillaceae bacterium]